MRMVKRKNNGWNLRNVLQEIERAEKAQKIEIMQRLAGWRTERRNMKDRKDLESKRFLTR